MIHNPGRRRWALRQMEVAGIHLQQGDEGSGGIAQGQSPADGYLLFLPRTAAEGQRANGVELKSDSIAILEPGSEFCLTAHADHTWYTVLVPFDRLAAQPEESRRNGRVRHVAQGDKRHYLRLINRIFAAVEANPSIISSGALSNAMQDLCRMSAHIVGHCPRQVLAVGGRPRIPRDKIIERLRRLLEASEGKSLSMAGMVTACGASERTVRSVIHEYFGVSPRRFLSVWRLHQVRKSLRAARPDDASVTELLSRCGVWEFGRFAGQYRAAFGELPSATLKMRRA